MFPTSSQFVIDVNLGNNTIQFAHDEFAAAIQNVGWSRIRALECSRPGVSTFDEIGGDMAETGGVTMLLQLQQWNLCLRLP